MAENTNNRITRMLLSKNRRAQYVKVFAVLAVCVTAAVAFILHQNGVAMTHEEQVLTCPIEQRIEDGEEVLVAHQHDSACYDSDGNLICNLPERELHEHTEDCYTITKELVCGKEEGEDGHVHTDDCYVEISRELTCGKEEVTEEHQHGPGCFTTITVNDGESEEEVTNNTVDELDSNSDDSQTTNWSSDGSASSNDVTSDGSDADTNLTIGAESDDANMIDGTEADVNFQETLTASDGNDYVITVNCPADAKVPQNAELQVTEIVEGTDEYKAYYDKMEQSLDDDDDVSFARFFDIKIMVDGVEFQPEAQVTVKVELKLKEDETTAENAKAIHFTTSNQTEVIDADLNENTVVFGANSFSVYGVAGTEKITTRVITAEGETYSIEVTYGLDAEIPKGAWLTAREIVKGTEEYQTYLAQAQEALGITIDENSKDDNEDTSDDNNSVSNEQILPSIAVGEYKESDVVDGVVFKVIEDSKEEGKTEISFARFFDIKIMTDQGEVEPKAPVQVKVEYLEPVNIEDENSLHAVHFTEEGTELIDADLKENNPNVTELTYTQSSFSVSGTVITVTQNWNNLSNNNTYVMYITNAGKTYAVKHDGTLNEVTLTGNSLTFSNANTVQSIDDYLWIYKNSNNRKTLSYQSGWSTYYLDPTQPACVSNSEKSLSRDNQNRIYNGPNYIGIQNNKISRVNSNQAVEIKFANAFAVDYVATVHFVDRYGNALTGVNYNGNNTNYITRNQDNTFTIRDNWNGQTGTIDFSRDFTKTNYTYASTHLAGNRNNTQVMTYNGLTIDAALTSQGNYLQFATDFGGTSSTEYSALPKHTLKDAQTVWDPNVPTASNRLSYAPAGDKDIYVILDPVSSGSVTGDTNNNTNSIDVDDPSFMKKLEPNNDGTYTLSLSVTGKAKNQTLNPKANVLLIVDTSSSMDKTTTGSGTRIKDTHDAVISLSTKLFDKNSGNGKQDTIEMAMVTFDGGVDSRQDWTTDKSTFQTSVNTYLTTNNTHKGTDWEDGLDKAYELATQKQRAEPDQPVFVIFFTDGEPSQYREFHHQDSKSNVSGRWLKYFSYFLSRETAKDEARAIVGAGITLYGVYAYNSSNSAYNGESGKDLLHNTIKYAYNTKDSLDGTYFHEATNTTALNKAFTSILKSIEESVGFSDVVMRDEITSLTSTGISLIAGATNPAGFKYTRSGGTYGSGQTWSNAPKASYSTSNGVTWDLGDAVLEDNVTYTLSFTVWPSQEAYNWVADLNNGIKKWSDVVNAGLESQFIDNNGVYEVKTNPDSVDSQGNIIHNKITYKKTKSETVKSIPQDVTPSSPIVDGNTTTTYTENSDGTYTKTVVTTKETAFNPPDKNMGLEDTEIKVQKEWKVSLQPTQLISFLYNTDTGESNEIKLPFDVYRGNESEPYMPVLLGWDNATNQYKWADDTVAYSYDPITDEANNTMTTYYLGTLWEDSLNIATGLMLSKDKAIEHGLDINDTTKYKKVTDNNNQIYYVLETGYDFRIQEPTLDYHFDFETETYHPMVVDGILRSVVIDGERIVSISDESGLTSLKGTNTLRGGINLDKHILDSTGVLISKEECPDDKFTFSITLNNNSSVFERDNIPWYSVNGYYYHDAEGNYGPDGEGMTGNVLTVTNDSKTASTEITITGKDSVRIANVPMGTEYTIQEDETNGYEFVSVIKDVEIDGYTSDTITNSTQVSGTIVPNAANDIIYTNRRKPGQYINILKTAEDQQTPLPGAEFSLYSSAGYNKEPKEAIKTDLVSDNTGKIDLGRLYVGDYYLVETKAPDGYMLLADPVEIKVSANGVLYDDGTSISHNGTGTEVTNGVYTLKVTNNHGVVLPNTGGHGTQVYTLGGVALVCAAAVMYGFKMGRRERRSRS